MDNVCRSCLTTAAVFSYSIYKDISPQTYRFCTSIEVHRDELPQSLCGPCYQLIIKFTEFKKLCIQSENKLLEFSKSLVLGNETCFNLNIEIRDLKPEKEDQDFSEISEANFCEDIDTSVEGTGTSVLKLSKPTDGITKPVKRKKPHKHNFECGQCNRKFAFKERLEGHMLKHLGKIASIQCDTCNKTFRQWSGLRCHIESFHSRVPFKAVTCRVCSKVCKTPSTLRIHEKTHEERRVRVCDECGKTFKSDVTFKNHLQTHLKNRERFTCAECGKNYISKKTYAKHVYRRHTDRKFICSYCNFVFTDKTNLIRHIMSHEGRHPRYKCDICPRSLTSRASLLVHKRIHSGERPFTCRHCLKGFKDKGRLVEHERVHTGDKPFQCVECAFRCSRRGSLRRHMKVHKKEIK